MTQAPSWLRRSELAPPPDEGGADTGFSVLFVCTGNICRSAFAEIYLRDRLGPSSPVTVSSAGIMAVAGHDLEDRMAARAQALGLPRTGHVARQLNGRILAGADLVVVFEEHHLTWVLEERPETLLRTVSLGQAAAAATALGPEGTLPWTELAPRIHALRPSPLPEDWIPDPYGRGPEAASAVAGRITHDIDTLLAHVAPPQG